MIVICSSSQLSRSSAAFKSSYSKNLAFYMAQPVFQDKILIACYKKNLLKHDAALASVALSMKTSVMSSGVMLTDLALGLLCPFSFCPAYECQEEGRGEAASHAWDCPLVGAGSKRPGGCWEEINKCSSLSWITVMLCIISSLPHFMQIFPTEEVHCSSLLMLIAFSRQ